MSKQLSNLIEKAQRKGSATLNGRMVYYDYGTSYKDDLREKYFISLENNILIVRHWGTETLKADLSNKKVISFYGESVSDRKSLNFIVSYFDLPYYFRWLPSKEEFHMIQTESKELTII